MRTLEFYRALKIALEVQFNYGAGELFETLESRNSQVEVNVNGENIVLNWNNVITEYEVVRLDEDMTQYSAFRVDKDDEYIIFQEGYYDSWSGGEFDGKIKLGKMEQVTVEFPVEVE